MSLTRYIPAALIALTVAGAGCGSPRMEQVTPSTPPPQGMMPAPAEQGVMVGGAMMVRNLDIVANAMNANNVTTLVAAVKAAGLVETLKGPGPFTVFAPTNDAFNKLPAGTVNTLLKPENKAKLVDVLTYHVVPGALKISDLKNGQMLTTVEGKQLMVTTRGDMVMINGAKIETRDVISSNGVTHVVDTVLMPPEGVMVGGALMVRSMNIVENAMNANNVTTLVAAVKAAGLVQTLSGPGPFTVFAPTNDAFSALPAGTVDTLLKPENKAQLTGILTYHVVPGALRAADLKEGQMLTTVNGATLKVTKRDGNTYVNGVMVQTADVISSNGVTHVVPSVLMPPTK